MPINSLVNAGLDRRRRKRAETLCNPLRTRKALTGREHMTLAPDYCRHHENVDACRRSLILASREGSLEKHCIFEGLRANFEQCRQILRKGLYDPDSPPRGPALRGTAEGGQEDEFQKACKQVLLTGYRSGIKAVREVFYESYYRLVRYFVRKCGITDDGQPGADDASQQVFLALHKYLSRGLSVKYSLAAYIKRTTINECIEMLNTAQKQNNPMLEQLIKRKKPASAGVLSPGAVEDWEHLDHRLSNSNQGDLINRIILAQQCIEGCATGRQISAKQLMATWKGLSQLPNEEIRKTYEETVLNIKNLPSVGLIRFAANLINTQLIEAERIAIVLAAGSGMDLQQTKQLIDRLSKLSSTAVYARICRIYMILREPEGDER